MFLIVVLGSAGIPLGKASLFCPLGVSVTLCCASLSLLDFIPAAEGSVYPEIFEYSATAPHYLQR